VELPLHHAAPVLLFPHHASCLVRVVVADSFYPPYEHHQVNSNRNSTFCFAPNRQSDAVALTKSLACTDQEHTRPQCTFWLCALVAEALHVPCISSYNESSPLHHVPIPCREPLWAGAAALSKSNEPHKFLAGWLVLRMCRGPHTDTALY
jgi:hypothetical protein